MTTPSGPRSPPGPTPHAGRLRFVEAGAPGPAGDGLAQDVRTGLTASPKRLSCRYLYDEAGSALFEQICRLPEYYLTRAERQILARRSAELAAAVPADAEIVELGSGSAEKTRLLLSALHERHGRVRYVPVDLSASALLASARALLTALPGLEVEAIRGEYEAGLRRLERTRPDARLVLWLGSNVGNLDRPAAAAFLRRIAGRFRARDRLLLGVDLRKDPARLLAAYDDARGLTARFNRNLLVRVARELAAPLDPSAFDHRATWDEDGGRIDMWLVSHRPQRLRLAALGLTVELARGEAIHTESSFKYDPAELDALVAAAGLAVERRWTDLVGRFCVVLLARD